MKDMGVKYPTFDIRITRDYKVREICLDQEKHLNEILKRFSMEDGKAISTQLLKRGIVMQTQASKDKKRSRR